MSDLFAEENENAGVEAVDDFVDAEGGVDVTPEVEVNEPSHRDIDARRRLENKLDDKRLQRLLDELDDFNDY